MIADNLDRVCDLESIMDRCDPENPPRLCCNCPAEDMCCDWVNDDIDDVPTDEVLRWMHHRPIFAEMIYKAYQAGILPTTLAGELYEPDMEEMKKAYYDMFDFVWDEW